MGSLILFYTFEGTKKLPDINYILLEVNTEVALCYYEGDRYGGQGVTDGGIVRTVFWNDKYIIAYAEFQSQNDQKYYIIEQLETDTFISFYPSTKKIPWTTYHETPWIREKYEEYDDFNKRLHELNIDTTQMRHYTWKYKVGIY